MMNLKAAERKSLRKAGQSLIREWLTYGQKSGPEALESIRKMLREVKTAVERNLATGEEPETGRWHDNQCVLYSVVRRYRELKKA